ncbi:unnamed protein product [Aphanomyces euteiches]
MASILHSTSNPSNGTPPGISSPGQDVQEDDWSSGRSKFACRDDVVLLTQVVLASPWAAGHKKVMAAWEDIAKNCARQPGFGLKTKKGPALKTRFSLLLETFKKGEMASMRKSGATEEFEEREILLTDIKSRIDDYSEVEEARKEINKKKKDGIESSGRLLRQLAMDESVESSCRKRKRSSPTKNDVVEGILATIKESIAEKREREERLLAEQRERLEFEKAEAKANADRFAANQEIMLSLISAILKKD